MKQLYSNKNQFGENEEQRNRYRAQSWLGIVGFARLRDNYFHLARYTELLKVEHLQGCESYLSFSVLICTFHLE